MFGFRLVRDSRAPREIPDSFQIELDDIKRRLKVIEREHDDLHAAYRRLRAAKAVEARDAGKDRGSADEIVDGDKKSLLRKKAAALLRGGPRTGNNE